MKIRRLELVGFKSFVEPTTLEFDAPLVGVIGPNGCGKSNILDAIRWVMGEMSAKSLRGRGMEDVIFNGSEARSPVGMAEVSLTFSTEDGIVPTAYAGFSEITITRRLFRSGESEYLINKIPCRLRDIVDLFLGTGVGHRAYSIVEQGRIDFAIHAKPEDRRLMIEEVAGISKFKARKESALRKMEATEQNLARLKDILQEVTRQINSLERQVKKAERYRALKDEVRALDVRLAATNFLEASHELAELEGLRKDWNQREIQAQGELAQREAEAEALRLKIVLVDRENSSLQEKTFEVSSRLKLLQAQQEFLARERDRLEEEKGKSLEILREGEKVRQGLKNLEEGWEELLKSSSSVETQMAGLKERLETEKRRKETLEEDLAIRREELSLKRSRFRSLLELEKNFEGYEEGVRTILRQAHRQGGTAQGVLGVVADIVETPPQYEVAVSAALGEKLQYVIVKGHEEGVEAITYLKSQASGRSTFIPLTMRPEEVTPFLYESKGVIGPLLNLVRLKENYASIGNYLLGDVVLVETLRDALSLWEANGHRKTLVTLEGEVVDPFGVVSGGSEGLPGKLILEKKREIKELRAEVRELEEEIALKEDSVSQFEGTLSEISLNIEEFQKARHEGDLKRITMEKEREGLKKEAGRLEEEEETVKKAEARIAEIASQREKESREKGDLEKGLAELTVRSGEVRAEFEKSSKDQQGFETRIRELRKEYDLARSHTADLRVTFSRLESDLRHLEQEISEKYTLSLQEAAPEYQEVEIDRPTEEQRLAELKERFARFGDVNLAALGEFEELKSRENFLGGQVRDLEEALVSLKKAIQKINETTRKRFEETFSLVNERFQTLFPRLFQGGRSELRLVEGDDHPNPGVELLVQPPGKKLSHIGLLSGGEKALSALAFVFSLFLVKPSPFCILDEVDAPLDDVNVSRFHRLLKEMLSRSQFIVITHNERTMEQCDVLFGITMEEAGVSKVVSVKLSEAEPALRPAV